MCHSSRSNLMEENPQRSTNHALKIKDTVYDLDTHKQPHARKSLSTSQHSAPATFPLALKAKMLNHLPEVVKSPECLRLSLGIRCYSPRHQQSSGPHPEPREVVSQLTNQIRHAEAPLSESSVAVLVQELLRLVAGALPTSSSAPQPARHDVRLCCVPSA